jgi:hypothetical protein
MLLQIEDGVDIKSLCEGSPKMEALYQGLYRKGLITDDQKITARGKEMIKFVEESSTEEKLPKRKIVTTDFDLWWKTYPGTDTFTHQGKGFSGSRSLRVKREDCKAKFKKILEEGEYTANDLIEALKFEVNQKKANSIKEKANKLTFMQNSLTYLNQRTFEPFIELIKSGITIVEHKEVQGGTDI